MAYTELQAAAACGDANLVTKLIDRGAGVNSIGSVGTCTALHVAAGRGHDSVVSALLNARASVFALDDDGRTAAHWAEKSG